MFFEGSPFSALVGCIGSTPVFQYLIFYTGSVGTATRNYSWLYQIKPKQMKLITVSPKDSIFSQSTVNGERLKISSLGLSGFWDIQQPNAQHLLKMEALWGVSSLASKLCNFQKSTVSCKINFIKLLQLQLCPLSVERKASFQLEMWQTFKSQKTKPGRPNTEFDDVQPASILMEKYGSFCFSQWVARLWEDW